MVTLNQVEATHTTPSIATCLTLGRHTGAIEKKFFTEQEDDTYSVLVGAFCGACHLPTGDEHYADLEDRERYYDGKPPKGSDV